MQVVGSNSELGLNLENHVILIQLSEESRDLALAEGVIESLINARCGDAYAHGGLAIDIEAGAETVSLEVARDIGQVWKIFQPVDEACGVTRKLIRIGIFD